MALTTSAVIGLIGAAAGAAGGISQANAAKKQGDFQANIATQQAEQERIAAAEQERDYRKEQSARLAQIRASMGASGTDTSTGTPLLALSDFEGETERNALRIRSGGDIRASRLDQQGSLYRTAGRNAQSAGYGRAFSSMLSAGNTKGTTATEGTTWKRRGASILNGDTSTSRFGKW